MGDDLKSNCMHKPLLVTADQNFVCSFLFGPLNHSLSCIVFLLRSSPFYVNFYDLILHCPVLNELEGEGKFIIEKSKPTIGNYQTCNKT
jgi:hypothetical protein